tara:strand:- start:1659 stop:2498 length:840 start_codon:yes stop_codon:yes gene_type:complete
MARRAFIGINRRTDDIKPPRKIFAGVAGGPTTLFTGDSSDPNDPGLPTGPAQTVNGLPVDMELIDPIVPEPKGNEDVSKEEELVILKDEERAKPEDFPPPPPPPLEDIKLLIPDDDIKSLNVSSSNVKQQKVLGTSLKDKKKKKKKFVKRKPERNDIRKAKSKKGNARNNIKVGFKPRAKASGPEAVINIINEQIDITRKTKKKRTPAPVRSMVQIVRPRPSVPVVEVRPTRTIAGAPIRRPAPPVPDVPPPPTPRPIAPTRSISPTRSTRPTRRGGRY